MLLCASVCYSFVLFFIYVLILSSPPGFDCFTDITFCFHPPLYSSPFPTVNSLLPFPSLSLTPPIRLISGSVSHRALCSHFQPPSLSLSLFLICFSFPSPSSPAPAVCGEALQLVEVQKAWSLCQFRVCHAHFSVVIAFISFGYYQPLLQAEACLCLCTTERLSHPFNLVNQSVLRAVPFQFPVR